jgi:hypothetical protein
MKTAEEKTLLIRKQFEREAKLRRCDPQRLVAKFMRECLEVWEDERLDKQIARQARRSGHKESEAVGLVREMRQAKRRLRGKP